MDAACAYLPPPHGYYECYGQMSEAQTKGYCHASLVLPISGRASAVDQIAIRVAPQGERLTGFSPYEVKFGKDGRLTINWTLRDDRVSKDPSFRKCTMNGRPLFLTANVPID